MFDGLPILSNTTKHDQTRSNSTKQGIQTVKRLANEDTLLRTHCCRHKCSLVCPRAQQMLRTQLLRPRHKKCLWSSSETFCVRNKCFPVCVAQEASWATMCPSQCVLVCQGLKARVKRRTSHEPNRMQMKKASLAFDSARGKCGVWPGP